MAVLTKTRTTVKTLATVTNGSVEVGAWQDVSTKFGVGLTIRLGRVVATALTSPIRVRLEASPMSTGTASDGKPMVLWDVDSEIATAADQVVNGTAAAAQPTINLTDTTGFSADHTLPGHRIFVKASTIADSEFGRIKSLVTNTSITLEENLNRAQTGSTVYGAAEVWSVQIDISLVLRVRYVIENLSGQDVAVEIEMVTLDSLG